MNEATRILHSIPSDPLTGSIAVPIYQTSTFVQESPGVHKGFDYARTANPTRRTLEAIVAGLENGYAAYAFASGLAAVDAIVKLLKYGDEIVCVDDVYGGTFRLFERVFSAFGVRVCYVDFEGVENVSRAITDRTRLLWIETPTNPTLKIVDIRSICALAHQSGILVCVDNTFATPLLQRPLELGADLVVHSATKYLAGHSDVIAGVVVTRTEELADRIKFIQNATGAILSPFDSWLVIRGIETLSLRIERQCQSALKIAESLTELCEVDRVNYPGLHTHRQHNLAVTQQGGRFGAMISFSLSNDSLDKAVRIASTTSLFKLAESLGGVKSLIAHPATMTHKSIPADVRKASGVADSLIRLSVGVEHWEDLRDDICNAVMATA